MTQLFPAPNGYPIKMVRDQTAATVNPTGEPGDLFYRAALPPEDRGRWLRKKLVEEVGEYLIDGGFGELRDVLAVVAALAVEHGSTFTTLVQAMQADPRGGFADGVMMFGYHPEFDGADT